MQPNTTTKTNHVTALKVPEKDDLDVLIPDEPDNKGQRKVMFVHNRVVFIQHIYDACKSFTDVICDVSKKIYNKK